MKPDRSLLLTAAALALLTTSTDAQARSGKVFARYNRPLKSATLDMATGTITRGPTVSNRAAATVTDFYNLDLSGFVGVDTGGGFCNWIDAAVKGSIRGDGTALVDSGNVSDLVTSFVFVYCSAALDPASGGPGGSVRLGFYEGYTTFGGAPTTTVAAFTLTGLPGNSASSSFFGGFDCHFLHVVFPSLVCFADGPIGYSWKFLDTGTGSINPQGATLAATWPFLACVATCSGAILQIDIDGQGMRDAIDQYCPPGYLRSTFTFGTTSGTFTSMAMAIEEAVDTVATVVGFNSTANPNPDILATSPAIVGQSFTASVTLGLSRVPGSVPFLWDFWMGSTLDNPTAGTLLPAGPTWGMWLFKKGRRRLVPFGPVLCTGTHSGVKGSTSSVCSITIPKTLSLVCSQWYAQARVYGQVPFLQGFGKRKVTSAVGGIIGTH